MPGVQQGHGAGVGIACVEAYGEDFSVDKGNVSGAGGVLIVVLEAVIVGEIFALGDNPAGVEFFEL